MKNPTSSYTILVLDDHPVVLEGIKRLLSADSDMQVEGVTHSSELFQLLEQGRCFQLFILDLELPDTDGFEAMATIRSHCPEAAILIYTMHEEPWILARLARLNIQGVVSKSSAVEELSKAVEAIRNGQNYYNETFVELLAQLQQQGTPDDVPGPTFSLSDREQEVLRCISEGLTTSEIAERLFISQNTVGTYRRRLMTKLGAHNVAQLIANGRKYPEKDFN